MGWSGSLPLRTKGQHCEDTAQGLHYKKDIYGAISLSEKLACKDTIKTHGYVMGKCTHKQFGQCQFYSLMCLFPTDKHIRE